MEGNSSSINKGILLGLLGSAVVAGSAFALYSKKQKESQEKTNNDHPNAKRIISKSEFTILTFNDIYELEPVDDLGGLAEMTTLLQKERAKTKHSITTVNGDFMAATIIASITKGAHMIDIMNSMKVDFVVLGNHEFDYSPKETKKRIEESNFKWLGTNVLDPGFSFLYPIHWKDRQIFEGVLPYEMREIDGFMVGIFGITTAESVNLSYPEDSIFEDIFLTSKKTVMDLRGQGADLIIAITHQSIQDDRQLARNVEGIDIILGGHDHAPYTIVEGNTLIQKSGQNAQYLCRLDISLERIKTNNTASTRVKWSPSWRMIANRGFAPDKQVHQKISGYFQKLYSLKSEILCVTKELLDSSTEGVRSRETTMGNLVCDVLRDYFKTDVVIMQGGSIRGDSIYQPGTSITKFDIIREFPFRNLVDAYKLKGSDLREAMEEGIRHLPAKLGCFPQLSGMKLKIDASKPIGKRVVEITVGGFPLDPNYEYTVASTRFIRHGGDGYQSLRNGVTLPLPMSGEAVNDILTNFLQQKKTIEPHLDGRIVFV